MQKNVAKDIADILDGLQFDAGIRALFEHVPGLHFFIKDTDGRLVACNETHRHGVFRYETCDQIFGKGNFDFFPNALAAAFAEDDRQVVETGEPILERVELNIIPTGSLSWFCTSKFAARDATGKIVGLLGISRQLKPADRRLSEFRLLLPAIDHIHEHRTAKIQVSHLATLCDMGEATFRREFKRRFRITPMQFIIRMRLHEACSRLSATEDSIGEIAYQCGFDDQNYFARQFKQAMGVSPSVFRAGRQV